MEFGLYYHEPESIAAEYDIWLDNSKLSMGTNNISCTIDTDKFITESSETNNTKTISITVKQSFPAYFDGEELSYMIKDPQRSVVYAVSETKNKFYVIDANTQRIKKSFYV